MSEDLSLKRCIKLPGRRGKCRWLDLDNFLFPEEFKNIPLKGYKPLSTLVGEFYEILVSKILDAKILKTDPLFSVCPDLEKGKSIIEVKAGGVSGIRIYNEQLAKYNMYRKYGLNVWYALCQHNTGRAFYKRLPDKTYDAALYALSESTACVLIVDIEVLNKIKLQYHDRYYEYQGRSWEFFTIPKTHLFKLVTEPQNALTGYNIGIKNLIITQMFIKDIKIADNLVSTFPITFIMPHTLEYGNINPEELNVIMNKIKKEEEAPF